jgi:hypothetical protein
MRSILFDSWVQRQPQITDLDNEQLYGVLGALAGVQCMNPRLHQAHHSPPFLPSLLLQINSAVIEDTPKPWMGAFP